MRATVCHKETVGAAVRYTSLALVLTCVAVGQTANWRKVGSYDVDLMLASPATGPVDSVWFGSDGRLFARTHSGKTFETADFEIWLPSADPPAPPAPTRLDVARLPEPGARIVAVGFGRAYALGKNLFRSDDAGLTWSNLTGFKAESVIGGGQRSVAIGPNDQIVAANDFGFGRSRKGGPSWAGWKKGLRNWP